MSFFEQKIITVKIRNRRMKFLAVSQTQLIEAQKNFKYYGKLDDEEVKNHELLSKAADELVGFILSKYQTDEGEEKPTADELKELTSSELQEISQAICSITQITQLNVKK